MKLAAKSFLFTLGVVAFMGTTQGGFTTYMDRVYAASHDKYDNLLGQIGECYRDIAGVPQQVAAIKLNMKCKQQQLEELSRGNGSDLRSVAEKAQALSACTP